MAEHVTLLLRVLAHACPSWKPTKETIAVYTADLSRLAPLALEAACAEWRRTGNGFAPSVPELSKAATRLGLEIDARAKARRERLSNGLLRRRVAEAVEVLADPNATVPSVLDKSKRHAKWSARNIADAQAVLGEHRLTLEQARALLAQDPPREPTFEEQARDVAARARELMGLAPKGAPKS